MKVNLNANMVDQATQGIASVLRDEFKKLETALSNDYGGTIDHLWIDFELIEHHTQSRPPFPFRFQKRVGGKVFKLTGLPVPLYENVGHYSVRPDFTILLSIPLKSVATYALGLIYDSTVVLLEKQKKLGGFDAERFREDFVSCCKKLGHKLP